MNNEFELEDEEIINYITASNKLLKNSRLLDDNKPRFLLDEGEYTYEYKY